MIAYMQIFIVSYFANCWKHKWPKDQVMNTTYSFRSEGKAIGKLTKYNQISAKRRGEWISFYPFLFFYKNPVFETKEQIVQTD